MTLKRLFYWFWSTLLLGAVASFILGFIFQSLIGTFNWVDLLLLGFTFSSVSLLGFFCYLVFQWLAKGLIRETRIYQGFLFVIVVLVLVYIVYISYTQFDQDDLWARFFLPVMIVVVSILVTWLKVRWTNQTALIPTLFFMVVVTTFESIPSINPKGEQLPIESVFFTIFVLLLCNAWQILQLHRLTNKKEKS